MLPKLITPVPGPESKKLLKRLRRSECGHVTYSDSAFPVFIRKSEGSNVWDADGNRLIDFTSFFGVASLGHGNPGLRKVMESSIRSGWHAMGDVHPHESKVRAAESILSLMPKALSRVFFASSGSESVETALKTARLMTGNSRVIYFEGAYHGLGYGALQVTDRNHFRKPFLEDVGRTGFRLPFVECGSDPRMIKESIYEIRNLLKKKNSASTVILELIQGRGGVRKADPEWVKQLRRVTKQNKAVLIVDEIYTGFGRTGSHFAFQKFGIIPDLLCLGKAMSNGFPISACVMSRAAEAAWGKSSGEAKHTSTFLGNPLGCEMIAEVIRQMNQPGTVKKFQRQSAYLQKALEKLHSAAAKEILAINGEGMMFGIVFRKKNKAALVSKKLLSAGIITLPCGRHSNVLSLSPSFFIAENEINYLISSILRIV